jgi:hypothetical protein
MNSIQLQCALAEGFLRLEETFKMEVENVERNPGELKSISTLLIARLTNAAKGGGDSESTKDMAPWKTIAKTSLTTSLINKEFKTLTSIVDAFFT